jgi:hypothetical protein
MRKLLISVALATATIAAAVPAAAQDYGQRGDRGDRGDRGYGDRGWNRGGPSRQAVNELLRDLNRAENQIDRAAARRVISRREAMSLRREAQQIRFRLNAALRGGINGREFGELRVRVNRLEQRVRIERRDRDRHAY